MKKRRRLALRRELRSQMRPRCIIFDFGKVVVNFDHGETAANLARLSSNQLQAVEVFDLVFRGADELGFDLGKISTADFVGALRNKLGINVDDADLVRAWCDIFSPNAEVTSLLPFLRDAGYRLILASNTNELHYDWLRRAMADELSSFHEIVLSFEIGIAKPAREFFEYCLDRSGFSPAECVYVDDVRPYVEAAASLGMVGIHYNRERALISDLLAVGVSDRVGD